MRCACALLLPFLNLSACGTEISELIPKQPCVERGSYPGGGVKLQDIASASGMQLNGSAASVDSVLRITSSTRNAVGSAYFAEPIAIDASTSLAAHFAIRIGGGDGINGADGLAFVLQASAEGPRAVGLDGGGLGFQNVIPSLTVEFDPYHNDPDPPGDSHVAVMLDGDIDGGLIGYASPPFALNDGVLRFVWVDFEAATQTLRVYLSESAEKPTEPLLTQNAVELAAHAGPLAYAGFSASAGERLNNHDLVGEAWVGVVTLPACE